MFLFACLVCLHLRENAKHEHGYAVSRHGRDVTTRVHVDARTAYCHLRAFLAASCNRYFQAVTTFNQTSVTLAFDKVCLSITNMPFNSHEGPSVNIP